MDLTVPVSDPAAHYRRALEVLDIAPDADDGARLELWIRLGASLVLLGGADGLTMLRTAARTALRHGDAVALAQAVCATAPVPGGSTSDYRGDRLNTNRSPKPRSGPGAEVTTLSSSDPLSTTIEAPVRHPS
jgi:hypothetical protein